MGKIVESVVSGEKRMGGTVGGVRWITGYASEAPIILLINMISQRTTKSHSGNRGGSSHSPSNFPPPHFSTMRWHHLHFMQIFRHQHQAKCSKRFEGYTGHPASAHLLCVAVVLCVVSLQSEYVNEKFWCFLKSYPKINNIKMRKMVVQMENGNGKW